MISTVFTKEARLIATKVEESINYRMGSSKEDVLQPEPQVRKDNTGYKCYK